MIVPANPSAHRDLQSLEPRTLGRLTQPLAITEHGLAQLIGALQTKDAPRLTNAPNASQRGAVAVVPVSGPLSTKSDWYTQILGYSSYEGIARDFIAALENDEISAIAIYIDSPGGDVTGCGELSELIYAARGRKPIVAYCAGDMCSAAYWIGSAADRVVTSPSGLLGSIGVRTMMADWTGYLEKLGIKEYPIVSSQSPHKVLDAADPDDRERATAMVTALAVPFVDAVARNRGVTRAAVERDFGKGDVIVGAGAVKAGLADALGDFDSLIAQLNQDSPAPRVVAGAKGKTMKTPATATTDKPTASADMKCSKCASRMNASDPMYCGGCMDDDGDGDEDEDAKKQSRAFVASVLALVGETDPALAISKILELKGKAAQVDQFRGEAEAAKKAKEQVELSALLDAAVVSGKIDGPAGRVEMEKLAADTSLDFVRRALGATKAVATPALPRDPKAEQTTEQKAAGDTAPSTFGPEVTPEGEKMLRAIGITPEKFAEGKKRRAATMNPVEDTK